MRRVVQLPKLISSRRFVSSFPKTETDLYSFLAKNKESQPENYIKLLKHPEFQTVETVDSILPKLLESLSQIPKNHQIDVHNTVLENLLGVDSSLSTIHQREISKLEGTLTLNALVEIIKYNSGRVSSSWEIFERHYNQINALNVPKSEVENLIRVVIDKLINGETIDRLDQEEPFVVSKDSLIKASFLSNFLKDEEIKETLIKLALQKEEFSLIKYLGIEGFKDLQMSDNANELLYLYSIWNPKSFEKKQIEENVFILSTLLESSSFKEVEISYDQETFEILKNLNQKYPSFSYPIDINDTKSFSTFESLSELLKDYFMDSNLTFTPLRVSLLRAYGIHKSDFKETMKLYDEFSVIDKYSIDIIMTTMVNILSYQAVFTKQESFLRIAEALTPQPIPIKALQSLILATSQFDTDAALTLYNDYIKKVSKKAGKDGYSQTTLLTESLILGFVSKKDREFAYLLNDGAIINGLVEGDKNIGKIKAIFKRYGQIVGEETNNVDELLHYEVLNALRKI